ncbi:MAG: hypothetical protein COX37_00960 [Candidatus Nealsonbacteria bacterium CG23_combo_of_CG06-09_8_20_14_all_39_17]|uniref:SHSP domain-containing protein n=1 Tax=Candidatus Nealsonbacteria bacterium CG23_combo_of_CG06-09_8_20_14_all_39_17 TaxID=1974722 RepID=A0A2G9YUR0_9BACT|nr:MAG: hypothetical protein COX37_00960 [Candidatus Nealsonbacteria bacterium CG23_combo_of_CG06-09_8_20_14_all_39_17]
MRTKKPKKGEEEQFKTTFMKLEVEEIEGAQNETEKENPRLTKEEEAVIIEPEKNWPDEGNGELVLDVYQTEKDLVIQSAIAGIKPKDIDISIEREVITLKGERKKPLEEDGEYIFQECYWGSFSRRLLLPVEVDPERTKAEMKNGILTIRIPKINKEGKRKISVEQQ